MSRRVFIVLAVHLPPLIFKIFIAFLKLGHRRRWAVRTFKKILKKEGLPEEIVSRLVKNYETFFEFKKFRKVFNL
ncbi:MAG: hypothetical protein ACPL1Y_07505 [Thermoplasmata archaeon]